MAQRNTSIKGEQIRDAFFGAGLSRNGQAMEIATNAITDGMLVENYILATEVDGTTIEFGGGTALNVVANGIDASHIDETDDYTFSGTFAVATPTLDGQAANKSYVDGLVNGLDWKESVRVATTGNITLSGEQTLDGFLTSADRVLVKAQTTDSENGIYVSAAGAWARAADYAAASLAASTAVFVEEGTLAADTGWTCTNDQGNDTVGTHDLAYTQFSGTASLVAGIGLVKNVNTIDLDLDTLASAVVDVANDAIAIADATDGITKQESIADLMTAVVAGSNGLTATSGVLAVNTGTGLELDTDTVRIAASAAGDGLTGGGGSALSVNVGTGLEINTDTVRIATTAAGVGLSGGGGSALAVDLNEVATVAIDVANDGIAFTDNSDSDATKKSTIALLVAAIAGTGITASGGQLSADSVADQIGEADFVKSVQTGLTGTLMATFSGSAAVVPNSVQVYLNGMLQELGGSEDYTINDATGVVTFVVAVEAADVITLMGVLNN
jgi:hypothetical protein